jgi:hypothetical protein
MIDQRLLNKPGYKYLGYENGWPHTIEGNVMKVTKPVEVELCEKLGHQVSSYSSRWGEHHYWCDQCQIEWFCDSGD